MNLDLSDGDRAFRDEVRAFLAEHLQDDWREGQRRTTAMYPEPEVSGPWQRVLNDKGWLVPLWPREWGGTGWTALQRFIFETECALAGAPLVHPMGVRLVGPLLLHYGTEEQRNHYLPRLARGDDIPCFALTGPLAGSDAGAMPDTGVVCKGQFTARK